MRGIMLGVVLGLACALAVSAAVGCSIWRQGPGPGRSMPAGGDSLHLAGRGGSIIFDCSDSGPRIELADNHGGKLIAQVVNGEASFELQGRLTGSDVVSSLTLNGVGPVVDFVVGGRSRLSLAGDGHAGPAILLSGDSGLAIGISNSFEGRPMFLLRGKEGLVLMSIDEAGEPAIRMQRPDGSEVRFP